MAPATAVKEVVRTPAVMAGATSDAAGKEGARVGLPPGFCYLFGHSPRKHAGPAPDGAVR